MPASIVASNVTTTTGSEQTLASLTKPGVYAFKIDVGNLQSGDTLRIRLKIKVLSGGTVRELYRQDITGAQVAPNILQISVPVASRHQFEVSIQRTAGTDRSYPWSVLQVGTVSVVASGTLSVSTSESSLGGEITSNKMLVLVVDLNNQGSGVTTTLRAKDRARTGDSQRVAFLLPISGAPPADPDKIQHSVPLMAVVSGEFTAQRAGGSAFNMPWEVLAVEAN